MNNFGAGKGQKSIDRINLEGKSYGLREYSHFLRWSETWFFSDCFPVLFRNIGG